MQKKLYSYAITSNIATRNINPDDVNSDKIYTITFASENKQDMANPFYPEILHCRPDNVIMDRIIDGPVLLDHDLSDQVGVVREVRFIENDRGVNCLEADIMFSASRKGKEIQSDVERKIRRNVSVGFFYDDVLFDSEETLHIVKWMPFEISFVGLPVDNTVGVGRSIKDIEELKDFYQQIKNRSINKMDPKKTDENAQNNISAPNLNIRSADTEKESNRCIDLNEVGAIYKAEPTVITRAIKDGLSKEDFRAQLENKRSAEKPQIDKAIDNIGMSKSDVKEYSFTRAVLASIDNNWSEAKLEQEASRAVEKLVGKKAKGFYVPPEVLRSVKRRATDVLMTTENATGVVQSTIKSDSFIDILRDKMLLPSLGCEKMTNLNTLVSIPVKKSGGEGVWISQGQNIPQTKFVIDQVNMTPHIIAGYVEYTRETLQLANPSIEMLAIDDLTKALALPADLAGFVGTGADNQPTGIINTADVLTFNGTNFGYGTAVEAVAQVEQDNALQASMNWVGNATLKGKLKQIPLASNYPAYLLDKDNMMAGYPYKVKTKLPLNTLIFGDFSQLLMGEFGVLDILVNDKISPAANIRIYGFYMVDYLVKQKSAFTYSKTVEWNQN